MKKFEENSSDPHVGIVVLGVWGVGWQGNDGVAPQGGAYHCKMRELPSWWGLPLTCGRIPASLITPYGHVCTSHYFCGTHVLWSSSEYGGWVSSLTSPQHTWQLLRAAHQALDLLRGTSAGHTETIYVCV